MSRVLQQLRQVNKEGREAATMRAQPLRSRCWEWLFLRVSESLAEPGLCIARSCYLLAAVWLVSRSKSGTINGWELQIALEAMGQNPQEDDIRTIVVQLGAEKNGTLGREADTHRATGEAGARRIRIQWACFPRSLIHPCVL